MDSPKVKQEESEIGLVDTEPSPERAQSSEHEHNGVDVDLIDFDSPLTSDRVLHHDEHIAFDLEFPLLDFGGPHTARQPINSLLFDGEISPSGSAADSIACTISSSPVLSYCEDSDFTPISSHRPFGNDQSTPTSVTSSTCITGDSLTPRPPRASPFGERSTPAQSAESTQDRDQCLIRYPLVQVDDEGRTYHVYSPHLSPLSPSPLRANLADSSEIRSITPQFDDEGRTYHVYSPHLSALRANLADSSEIRSITPHFDDRHSSPTTSPFRRLTTTSEELADPDATQPSRYSPVRRTTIHTISSHSAHLVSCPHPSSLTPLEPLLLPYPPRAPHQVLISSSTPHKRAHDPEDDPEDEDNGSPSHKRHRGNPSNEVGDLLSWKFSLVPWKADLRIKTEEISKSLSDLALESSKLMDERADIRKEIHNARQAELNGGLDFRAVHEQLDQLSRETEAVQRRANSWRAISAYYLEKRSGLEQRVRRLETALREIMNEIQPAL